MASQSSEPPPDLVPMLQEFTAQVLRERPSEPLDEYAARYFTRLVNYRKNFTTSVQIVVDETTEPTIEPFQTSSEEDFEGPPLDMRNWKGRRISVFAEIANPDIDDEFCVWNRKTVEQKKHLVDVLKDIVVFKSLDEEDMQRLVYAMFEKKVEPGDHIIEQGDDGDYFYIIDSGKFEAYVKVNDQSNKLLVGTYDGAGFFGELALMYNQARAATVIAATPGLIWALDRATFKKIVVEGAFQKRKSYTTLIENVPILKSLDQYERMNVADALRTKIFNDGDQILKQGDSAESMYFVISGKVKIMMTDKNNEADGESEVITIEIGGYFGELALITKQPRAASAYAEGVVELAELEVHAFERLLGSCMEVMKRNFEDYKEQIQKLFGADKNEELMR